MRLGRRMLLPRPDTKKWDIGHDFADKQFDVIGVIYKMPPKSHVELQTGLVAG